MSEDRIAALEQKIAQQARELAALRSSVDRPPPAKPVAAFDHSAGLTMPVSVAAEIAGAVDPRPLVKDFSRGPAAPSSVLPSVPQAQRQPMVRGNGWVQSKSLEPATWLDRRAR